MRRALYFPYVRVPEDPWFSQILLYWETAATIAPMGLRFQDDSENYISPYTANLNVHGLLDFVDPDDFGDRLGGDDFVHGFLTVLERGPDLNPAAFERIHVRKMWHRLFFELEYRGLARKTISPFWWEVERATAGSYMAYLAGVLASLSPETSPVTDGVAPLMSGARIDGDFGGRRRHVEQVFFNRALPAPAGPIDPRELREFKDRHGDALRRCRRHLDLHARFLASISDRGERDHETEIVVRQMEDDVAALREGMLKRDWPQVTLIGVGALVEGGLSAAAGLVGSPSPLAAGLGIGAAAIGVARGGVDAYRAATRRNVSEPLAYAALAARFTHHRGARASAG